MSATPQGRLGIYNVHISPQLREISAQYKKFCALYGEPRSYRVPKMPLNVQRSESQQVIDSLRAAAQDFSVIEKDLRNFQKRISKIDVATGREIRISLGFFFQDIEEDLRGASKTLSKSGRKK